MHLYRILCKPKKKKKKKNVIEHKYNNLIDIGVFGYGSNLGIRFASYNVTLDLNYL